MSEPITLRVPRLPPTKNAMKRQYRHWAAYKRLREVWAQELLYVAVRGASIIPQATGKMRVTIRVGKPGRPVDVDAFSVEPILDTLSRPRGQKAYGFGWIRDDHPDWCELVRPPVEKSPEPWTEITLESIA